MQPTLPRMRARATDISAITDELTSCSQTPSLPSASSPPFPASRMRSSRAESASPATARRETAASWATGATCLPVEEVSISSPEKKNHFAVGEHSHVASVFHHSVYNLAAQFKIKLMFTGSRQPIYTYGAIQIKLISKEGINETFTLTR